MTKSTISIAKRKANFALFNSKVALKIAKEATRQATAELDATPRHLLNEGNPNHPMYDNKLFGYDEKEFLAKQYKRGQQ